MKLVNIEDKSINIFCLEVAWIKEVETKLTNINLFDETSITVKNSIENVRRMMKKEMKMIRSDLDL